MHTQFWEKLTFVNLGKVNFLSNGTEHQQPFTEFKGSKVREIELAPIKFSNTNSLNTLGVLLEAREIFQKVLKLTGARFLFLSFVSAGDEHTRQMFYH